jgi:DNA-binding MltR family transcriptional regulator
VKALIGLQSAVGRTSPLTVDSLRRLMGGDENRVEKNANRTKVIVDIARIEEKLTEILRAVLVPCTDTVEDNLLGDGGPLGTVMLKAKLCVRLGLVSSDMYLTIKKLSKIRNKCAHEPDHFDIFNDQVTRSSVESIFDLLNKELSLEFNHSSVADKFNTICFMINVYLDNQIGLTKLHESCQKELIFAGAKPSHLY